VRMYHTILGHGGFHNGLQTFFKQHDGTVSNCTNLNMNSSVSPVQCFLHSAVVLTAARAAFSSVN
jgi:hypothetical protein